MTVRKKTVVETTKNTFKIILPNIDANYETREASALEAEVITSSTDGSYKKLSDEEKVLKYTHAHGAVTKNDVIALLEVSASTASRVIRKMVNSNLLKRNGKARNTKYTVIE